MGSPSRLCPSGRLIAGWPEMLNAAVNGPYSKMCRSQERAVWRGLS
jgi:hypothetical protein